jgi:hypothetical protein
LLLQRPGTFSAHVRARAALVSCAVSQVQFALMEWVLRRPMMVFTYGLIVVPSALYFWHAFPKASWWEQILALVLLPTTFLAFSATACNDPGVARKSVRDTRGRFTVTPSGGDEAALAGVSAAGLDFSSSGIDADGIVAEDTAAQRRAVHSLGGRHASDSSNGFRRTWHEEHGVRTSLQEYREPKTFERLSPGEPLPPGHPEAPLGSMYCDDCGVVVQDIDHHCAFTGQVSVLRDLYVLGVTVAWCSASGNTML